jgi:type IX secretion system PorP/SprF family membrane protein
LVEGTQGFSTYAASYDQFLTNLNSGIGISLMSDNAANIYRRTSAALTYAYRVRINEDLTAKIGIQGGILQNFLDWDKLVFPDQLDPIRGAANPTGETRPLQTSNMFFDVSTGILLYAENFHFGLCGQHLSSPNESFINLNNGLRVGLPIRWSAHGGYHHTIRKGNRMHPEVFIAPTILLTRQSNLWQVNGGAYMGFGPIFGGLWFRHTFGNADAAIAVLGFQQPSFKIGYSYDYTVSSGLAGRSGGTHEVSLIFNLDPDAARRKDLTNCMKMFR